MKVEPHESQAGLIPENWIHSFTDRISEIISEFKKGFEPTPKITISEYAAKSRIVPKGTSSSHGKWNPDLVPYLNEIMDSISPDSGVEEIGIMKSAQSGGTEAAVINPLLFYIEIEPSPLLYVMPTDGSAQRASKKTIQPNIDLNPGVKSRVVEKKSRDSGNTILQKVFPGGSLTIAGANSPSNFRNIPIRIAIMDDLDGYPLDLDGTGSPDGLIVDRTKTYNRTRKIIRCSTPVEISQSQIWQYWLTSDQRKYFMPCPNCSGLVTFSFNWPLFKFDTDDEGFLVPGSVRFICNHCEFQIPESSKSKMLASGKWIPTHPERIRRCYHIWSAMAPSGWDTWDDIVKIWLSAVRTKKQADLKVFWTTTLGEPYDDEREQSGLINPDSIMARCEVYTKIPNKVLFLTAGVDFGVDRCELEIVGHGMHDERWSIDYKIIYGNPSDPNDQIWRDLDSVLFGQYLREDGRMMRIGRKALDTGYKFVNVTAYVKQHIRHGCVAIKGSSTPGQLPVPKTPTKNNKGGVLLFTIGTEKIKEIVLDSLAVEKPDDVKPGQPIPGYQHFPIQYDQHYFAGLTSEYPYWTSHKGKKVVKFKKRKNQDYNEPLDCRVYALAAFMIQPPNLEQLKQFFETPVGELTAKPRKRKIYQVQQ